MAAVTSMEHHPRIDLLSFPITQNKIILGSFPTWSLAQSNNQSDNESRKQERTLNNDFDFFYGSSSNHFWRWYYKYFDQSIILNDTESIKSSLMMHNVGITDMILSCQRKGKSALDKHLTKRVYNYTFLSGDQNSDQVKILCTSKAVLNQMLLTKTFLTKYRSMKIDVDESSVKEREILQATSGQGSLRHPIFRVLKAENGARIECLAIPSPGSPYRKLIEFGLREGNVVQYLDKYLTLAFTWFKS